MNNIRRISLGAIFALFSVAPSFATLWTGTITETVTSTNHPGYAVGDIYTGTYQYESDSIDGDFGTTAYFVDHHESSVGTLFTVLYDFAPLPGRDAWIRGSDGTFASQQHMIVETERSFFLTAKEKSHIPILDLVSKMALVFLAAAGVAKAAALRLEHFLSAPRPLPTFPNQPALHFS